MLAQLRFGILPIAMETGRYRGLPIENRICCCCNLMSVESEIHFFFVCPLYTELRAKWLADIVDIPNFHTLSEDDQFCYIFTKPRCTAKFVTDAMDKRNHLYMLHEYLLFVIIHYFLCSPTFVYALFVVM